MATGDNTASVPFPRLSQTRREGIPHVPGTTKSWPRRGAGARIIAKEHGLTPAGDAQEIRPSTESLPAHFGHEVCPRGLWSPWPGEICEFADLVDLHQGAFLAQLAPARLEPDDQLLAAGDRGWLAVLQ